MTDDQLFQKKQECASYKDNIQKEIDKNYGKEGESFYSISLLEIFYSPKEKSCLYGITAFSGPYKDWSTARSDDIYDVLSSKHVWGNSIIFNKDNNMPKNVEIREKADVELEMSIKELKGE